MAFEYASDLRTLKVHRVTGRIRDTGTRDNAGLQQLRLTFLAFTGCQLRFNIVKCFLLLWGIEQSCAATSASSLYHSLRKMGPKAGE